ncbi:hypothetical protein PILCRDRAFT_818391 [Piloderma croceum F 1598]|uniref:Uncharacterized protein n=1 Tax=Piloderma croceum (strain F 1598) TaxID=765440 RepID=A0A0C3BCQ0_PILCF|nr:hypothetical protein PILCRDRAFT_818391 [Piloderma croceum F 1598]
MHYYVNNLKMLAIFASSNNIKKQHVWFPRKSRPNLYLVPALLAETNPQDRDCPV